MPSGERRPISGGGSLTGLLDRRRRGCRRMPPRPGPPEWSSPSWVLSCWAAFQLARATTLCDAVTFPVASTLCKAGADPHPQGRSSKGYLPEARPARAGGGRHLLSVLFYLDGGIKQH